MFNDRLTKSGEVEAFPGQDTSRCLRSFKRMASCSLDNNSRLFDIRSFAC